MRRERGEEKRNKDEEKREKGEKGADLPGRATIVCRVATKRRKRSSTHTHLPFHPTLQYKFILKKYKTTAVKKKRERKHS